jgi:formate dehydrogenase maturation protein FdhE
MLVAEISETGFQGSGFQPCNICGTFWNIVFLGVHVKKCEDEDRMERVIQIGLYFLRITSTL